MNTQPDEESLERDILARASCDWVPVIEVLDAARETGLTDLESLRDLSIGLIARLIAQGHLVPGEMTEAGFSRWELSPGEAIVRIALEWAAQDSPLVIPGAVAWLDTTPSGEAIGRQVLDRERGKP